MRPIYFYLLAEIERRLFMGVREREKTGREKWVELVKDRVQSLKVTKFTEVLLSNNVVAWPSLRHQSLRGPGFESHRCQNV